MEWQDAMSVLGGWEGRRAVVVPYVEPGISLALVHATLALQRDRDGIVRLELPGTPIALRRSTFIEAEWVPGQEGRGLTVVQGGTRVDVFLDGDGDAAP